MEQAQQDQEPTIPPEEFIAFVTQVENLAAEISDQEADKIAKQVIEDYDMDKASMSDWLTRMEKAIDCAKLVKKEKDYPFKNAANVKYPLVTSAALQFNARSYPAIVPAQGAVKAQTFGDDAQGRKAARADRVSSHMSYQLVHDIEEWEEDTDTLLLQLPILGTAVRKWWFDPILSRPRCRLVKPGYFIVNNEVKTLSDAPRCSEKLPLYPAEIKTRIAAGQFVEFEWHKQEDDDAAEWFIEQHCLIDLDEDGYKEPYVATVHKETQKLVRLVADFEPDDVVFDTEQQRVTVLAPMEITDGYGNPAITQVPQMQMQEVTTGILSIRRGTYFVPHHFMPSLDGGFWGTGLGLLLGDISDAINSIINMLLDSGHMASLGGGFIGSEFRIKGGSQRFSPGEWKLTKERGGDIRNSIVPMSFPGPDATLFQLLGMLIEAGRELSSIKDVMTGDGGSVGKNASPTTTLALIEQGMMVFTAAYKRIFRSMRKEYALLAKMNARTLDAETYSAFHDMMDDQGQPVMLDPQADYAARDMDIAPVADPNSVTKMQEMAKAQLVMEMAGNGLANPAEAADRIFDAAQIPEKEKLVPQPDPMAQQMQQFQAQLTMKMMEADVAQKMADIENTIADIEKKKTEAAKNMAEIEGAEEQRRLEQLQMMLKERRDDLEQNLRAGLAGLEAESRDRMDTRSAMVKLATAKREDVASLRGGQSMAGSGSPITS